MYRESNISPWFGALLIAGAFVLMYGAWVIFPRELFRQECIYAVQSLEFTLKNPMVTVHGIPVRNAYPIYPALCSFLYRSLGISMETALRLVTVFFIAAGSVLVYFSAASGHGKRAGLVGAAMYSSTLLMLDKGVSGSPQAMSAFWLLAAQMSLFYFGLRRSQWNLAWPLCALLLMAGFFSGGFLVITLFLVPVFFLRRLIAGRAKYRNWGFLAALFVVLLGCLGKFAIQWNMERTTAGTLFFRGFTDPDYLGEFLLYWFRLPLRLFPWSFIAWIPFCAALQRIDNKPLFSKYLRVQIIVTAFILWLIPQGDGRELFYLPGALSILCGVYYELGMRRFGEGLRKLAPAAEYMALLVIMMIAIGIWGEEKLLAKCFSLGLSLNFRSAPELLPTALLAMAALAGIWVILRSMRERMPVWIVLFSISLMGSIFYSTIMLRYQAQDNSKGSFGRTIREVLQRDSGVSSTGITLYKTGTESLYGELFYTGTKVIHLPSADHLPDTQARVVYLISSEFPQNPKWSWTNLLPENFSPQGRRYMLWRGKRNFQEKFKEK
ncbi:MAG: glycosyltransferase family 39 protein [Lentisphaeria bacterium]|nr:glycosyltransferase family 39 protein [Lentisphaeria bacterium]